MTDLARLLANPALEAAAFPSNSRYYGAPLQLAEQDSGEPVVYITRRFPPQFEELNIQRRVVVAEGDRLDLLASTHFADPIQWWRIADSNLAFAVEELAEIPGSTVLIGTPRTEVGR